ncbi:hypothetical protein [Streptomyces sp. NPDC008150]|uniref:P-loop NTPase n=1 Tax=Streptomyces sp. NPDC008150 TaxID=3364816 RepID=UPI0036E49549
MSDNGTSDTYHFLSVTPLAQLEATVESVRALYRSGHTLDAIVVFGTRAAHPRVVTPGDTADLLDAVMIECLDLGAPGVPPVVRVPWRQDLTPPRAGGGMLVKALARYWSDTERELWRPEGADTADAVTESLFAEYTSWAATDVSFPDWLPGVLPGEGSTRIGGDGAALGIVVANTVFRMALPPGSGTERPNCTAEQLGAAVGGDYAKWAGDNRLTVVLGGHSAALPTSLGPLLPRTLLLAPEGEALPSRLGEKWQVTHLGAVRQHRVLRLEAGAGAGGTPRVRDLAAPQNEQPIPLPRPRRTAPSPGGTAWQAAPQAGEAEVLEEFYGQLGTGRMILVAVSGLHGETRPVDTDTFTEGLTKAVYGGVPTPPPTTPEIWHTALARLNPLVVDQHVAELRVDPEHFSNPAHRVLRAPWSRIYDLTATDLLTSMLRHDAQVTDTNTFVNALIRKPRAGNATVEAVAMHGEPTGPEGLEFSVPADDDVTPRALWFRKLKAELLCRPTAFMATSPSSRALWQALTLVPQRQDPGGRFPQFVITGPGTAADRERIRQAGFTHIEMPPHEFATRCLRPGLEVLQQGRRRLADVQLGARRNSGIKLVAGLVDSASAGTVEYLKGQDPTWGDVRDEFCAKLSIIDRIRDKARPGPNGRHSIVLVEGRAGSGKTTALMQYAYELHQAGRTVAWIDREATDPIPNLKAQAATMLPDAVFVDDVDIFGSLGASLLKELSNGGRSLVVAAIRTTRADELDVTFERDPVSADEPLKDEDLGQIVDILHKYALPGILKQHRVRAQKIDKLRELCDRSLLVAMIQVVTGKRFEDKVASEFHELDSSQVAVYATVCVFESAIVFKKRGIEQEDLLQIVSGRSAPRPALYEAIARLIKGRFLILAPDGTIRCRQRTIADTVVETVLKKNPTQLSSVVEFLLKFYAQYASESRDNDDPYRRIMIRLLNHSLMVSLRLKPARVREIYDTVHELLCDNFHYWLQRGEFELERGDLGIAENHLETAKGCEGGAADHYVLTAWSAIRLRRSTVAPADGTLHERAMQAIDVLEEVTRRHGGASPHSFSVVARRGTQWLEACERSLSADQIDLVLRKILDVIASGRRFCKDNHEFMRIADEYEPQLNRLLERSRGVPM